jgi:hypothetical protein
VKLAGLILALMLALPPAQAQMTSGGAQGQPQTDIWFDPLTSNAQFSALFPTTATWPTGSKLVKVFAVSAAYIVFGTPAQVQEMVTGVQARGQLLAIGAGTLTSGTCGIGVEGFDFQNIPAAINLVHAAGGKVAYWVIDESVYFGTIYNGSSACNYTVPQVVALSTPNMAQAIALEPTMLIGDAEPIGASGITNFETFATQIAAAGYPMAFFLSDFDWTYASWPTLGFTAQSWFVNARVPFGAWFRGSGADGSNSAWINNAIAHLATFQQNGGRPNITIVGNFGGDNYPTNFLPETDPTTLTSLILLFAPQVQP